MTTVQKVALALAGLVGLYLYLNRNAVESAGAEAEGYLVGWQNVESGPQWIPVINQTETALGIPSNLLARMAYEESHFIPGIIDGSTPSSAGALGILQLEPAYFNTVTVPVPFTTQDTVNQIQQAGAYLMQLYAQFGNWGDALAAYNDGPTNIEGVLNGTLALPAQTQAYVSDILADVPVQAASSVPSLNA